MLFNRGLSRTGFWLGEMPRVREPEVLVGRRWLKAILTRSFVRRDKKGRLRTLDQRGQVIANLVQPLLRRRLADL
jgi:hypothetical protein